MCNLNILIRKNTRRKKLLKTIPSFLMAVTSNSYVHNPDGDGFYAGGVIEKSINKIDLIKYKSLLMDSKIILTHQRISTSGLSKRYNHPFINKDFVLIHNGIINEFLGRNGSDTYGFFNQFCNKFYLSKGDRETRIRKCIKEILDGLEYGSFSIAILDKTTNNLYYFKNDNTEINFYINSELLYITTLAENNIFLTMFNKEFKEREVKDYRIYKINTGKEIKIKIIGRIKKPKNTYEGWGNYSYGEYQSNLTTETKIEKKVENHDINETFVKGRCANCNKKTRRWDINNACWLCKDCEKLYKYIDYRGMDSV